MAKKGESKFSADLSAQMRLYGACIYPMIASKYSPVGWPDKLVVSKQYFGLLEIKDCDTKLEIAQVQVIKNIRKMHPNRCYIVRQASATANNNSGGWILDENGTVLAWFNGTGRDLLLKLEGLK